MAVYGCMRMKTVIFQWLHFVSNGICPLTFFSKQSMMKQVNLQQSIKNKWNILENPRASHPLREGGECQRGSADRKERGNPISRVQPCQRKLIVMSLEDGQIWACLPVEGQGPSYGQPFEVAARVRIKQVPEAEGDDGLNKRTGLLTFCLSSYSVHALTQCSLAPSYCIPMKQGQGHQHLLHFGINFSAARDTVVHSLFHGKLLGSPDTTFSWIPCPLTSDSFSFFPFWFFSLLSHL